MNESNAKTPWTCERPERLWSLVDTAGRRWEVYRNGADHWRRWYARVNGDPVFSLTGKRPQYWAHLNKALDDVARYVMNGRWRLQATPPKAPPEAATETAQVLLAPSKKWLALVAIVEDNSRRIEEIERMVAALKAQQSPSLDEMQRGRMGQACPYGISWCVGTARLCSGCQEGAA